MKKIAAVLLLLSTLTIPSFAQDAPVVSEPVESPHHFDIGVGYNLITNYSTTTYSFSGPGALFEYRFRENSKFDFGGQLNYKYAKGLDFRVDEQGFRGEAVYNQACVKGLFDYNFCSDKLVNPYLGFGLGIGGVLIDRPDYTNTFQLFFTATPRAGVQIWHFRLTCEFDLLTNRVFWSSISFKSYGGSTRNTVFASILALNLSFTF